MNKINTFFCTLDTKTNFDKMPKEMTNDFGVQYDYGSVMHYSPNAFSINGQPTIVPKVRIIIIY